MTQRVFVTPKAWIGSAVSLAGCIAIVISLASCADTSPTPLPPPNSETGSGSEEKSVIIANILKLIEDAATNAGGENFNIATENLNHLFAGNTPQDFEIDGPLKAFLKTQLLPPGTMEFIVNREYGQIDGRHIEDCLLYKKIAVRVAGEGDDLTRARRLFDWTVRHTVLVPFGSLVPPQLQVPQAEARPYDVLLRGMASEDRAGRSERGWLFMSLCKQIGLDAGLITLITSGPPAGPVPKDQRAALTARPEVRGWACVVLVDGKAYLFDPAIGMAIPSADQKTVATLEEAATNPDVLSRLELPGRNYEPSPATLANSKVRILLETNSCFLSKRMKLFQDELASQNRMILYRDPVEQVKAFQKALGPRCKSVGLWEMPLSVQYRLFNDSDFNRASGYALMFFDPKWPLLAARLDQLRGDLPTAIHRYVSFRYSEDAIEADGKTRIAAPVQAMLDGFATYYLALAQLDKGDKKQADFLFSETLRLSQAPGQVHPFLPMFSWGAETNLGLLNAEAGQGTAAARHFMRPSPTLQMHGNLLRAQEILWRDPFAPARVAAEPTPAAAKSGVGPTGS